MPYILVLGAVTTIAGVSWLAHLNQSTAVVFGICLGLMIASIVLWVLQ